MADSAPVMVWISGLDKQCTWFNRPWLEFTGRTLRQEIGYGWSKGVHRDDFRQCLNTYSRAFDRRQSFSMEYRLRRFDGVWRWILDRGIPLSDQDGKFVGFIGSCIDITDRKSGEQALHESQERLRAILNTVADAVITIDWRGRIAEVNPAAEQMFGYTSTELAGRKWGLLLSPAHREVESAYLQSHHRSDAMHGSGIRRELKARRKDRREFPVDLTLRKIDHLRLLVGVVRDLSDRRRLEAEILRITEEERKRVAADLHDGICQEMVGIQYLSTLLQRDLEKRSPQLARRARRIAEALSAVADHTRQLARGMNPIVGGGNGLMVALGKLADTHGKTLRVCCSFRAQPPVFIEHSMVANELYRIAQEAVYNSVRHGRAKRIQLRLWETRHEFRLSILDDGIGVPADLSKSPGMGLRVMSYRAALLGGQVTVRPRKPSGTAVMCRVLKLPRDA